MKYRILLADDHPLVRKGIRSVIETIGIAHDILEAENGAQVLELASRHCIDLYILDFKMPVMNGFDAAQSLLSRNAKSKIMIVSMYDDAPLIANSLRIGVQGFLLKNTGIDEIELAIKRVMAGDIYFSEVIEALLKKESQAHRLPVMFTLREKDLIDHLARGSTSKDIAETWGLSLRTIETYRSRLLEKVKAKNTSELLSYFHKNGLV